MKYTVAWMPSAQDELTKIWLAASDRQAVADAADAIDQELATDADQKGTPYGTRRLFDIHPLVVSFKVSPDDRLVTVELVVRVK